MNKKDFKKLAILGITGGVLLSGQSFAGSPELNVNQLLAGHGCGGKNGCGGSNGNGDEENGNYRRFIMQRNNYTGRDIAVAEETSQEKMTEQDLFRSLNAETKAIYEGMTPEGRSLALELANRNGAYPDTNEAVRAAKQQIAEKRANSSSTSHRR